MFDEMKKKILIVDDERDIVDLLKYNIKKRDTKFTLQATARRQSNK